jgi:cytochrome c-type biogenesis protein CcmH
VRRALAGLLLAGALLVLPGVALAAAARTSLPDVEDSVMCPSCREPLALAQSVQANDERDFIRHLIAQGATKPQILDALVGQYGSAVLAKPPAHGFDLTVYVVPPAAVLAGLLTLAWALPRWRRKAAAARRATAEESTPEPGLAPADAARLEADLARFDG